MNEVKVDGAVLVGLAVSISKYNIPILEEVSSSPVDFELAMMARFFHFKEKSVGTKTRLSTGNLEFLWTKIGILNNLGNSLGRDQLLTEALLELKERLDLEIHLRWQTLDWITELYWYIPHNTEGFNRLQEVVLARIKELAVERVEKLFESCLDRRLIFLSEMDDLFSFCPPATYGEINGRIQGLLKTILDSGDFSKVIKAFCLYPKSPIACELFSRALSLVSGPEDVESFLNGLYETDSRIPEVKQAISICIAKLAQLAGSGSETSGSSAS